MPCRVAAAIACVWILSLLVPAGSAGAEDGVRVRVVTAAPFVDVRGRSMRFGGVPVSSPEVRVTVDRGRLRAGSILRTGPVVMAGSGELSVGGLRLPGSLVLRATDDGRIDVVNTVPLEPYVERVLMGEIFASWPLEVLKAQAVVARTYALHQRSRGRGQPFDVDGSVVSQVYRAGSVSASVARAAAATRGEYLAFEGRPILAVFHSSSGGRTASSEEVWSESIPYLRSVPSSDEDAPDYFWSYEIPRDDLRAVLRESGYAAQPAGEIRVLARSDSGRVALLEIDGVRLSGHDLRKILGGRAIRSALFEVSVEGDRALFLGSGAGHGVGLCQWGARKRALGGETYREILAHYYPGAILRRLDGAAGTLADGRSMK